MISAGTGIPENRPNLIGTGILPGSRSILDVVGNVIDLLKEHTHKTAQVPGTDKDTHDIKLVYIYFPNTPSKSIVNP